MQRKCKQITSALTAAKFTSPLTSLHGHRASFVNVSTRGGLTENLYCHLLGGAS